MILGADLPSGGGPAQQGHAWCPSGITAQRGLNHPSSWQGSRPEGAGVGPGAASRPQSRWSGSQELSPPRTTHSGRCHRGVRYPGFLGQDSLLSAHLPPLTPSSPTSCPSGEGAEHLSTKEAQPLLPPLNWAHLCGSHLLMPTVALQPTSVPPPGTDSPTAGLAGSWPASVRCMSSAGRAPTCHVPSPTDWGLRAGLSEG